MELTAAWFRSSSRGSGRRRQRKGKNLSWREANLSPAHAQGTRTPVYAGSIEGGAEAAGRQLSLRGPRRLRGELTVHAVGDGAPWIVGQVEEQFAIEAAT